MVDRKALESVDKDLCVDSDQGDDEDVVDVGKEPSQSLQKSAPVISSVYNLHFLDGEGVTPSGG